MNVPLKLADQNLSAWNDFKKFTDFAANKTDRTVASSEVTWHWREGHKLDVSRSTSDSVWKLWRSDSLKDANRTTREDFRDAVLQVFNLQKGEESRLPPSVLKALSLGDLKSGKPLTVRQIKAVDAAIRKWDSDCGTKALEDCQNRIDKILSDSGTYEKTLLKVASSNRLHTSNTDKRSYSLNGKVIETFSSQKPEDFLDIHLGKMKNPNDKQELKMRQALLAFCNDDVLPFSASNPLPLRGLKPHCSPADIKSTVTITKARGGGYNIVVKQEFSNIKKLSDPEGKREKQFFNSDKPLSCEVTLNYQLKMKNGRPVVSFSKNPEVKHTNYNPIKKEEFGASLKKNLQANRDKVLDRAAQKLGGTRGEKLKEWFMDWPSDEQRDDVFNNVFDRCVSNVCDKGNGSLSDEELAAEFVREYNEWEEETL